MGGAGETVPTPEFLNGDFSRLLDTSAVPLGTDKLGNPIYPGAILDPLTGNVFPGNVIPDNRISRVSRAIADIYRQSYQPQLPDLLINNNARPQSQQPKFHAEQFSIKLDHNFNEKHKVASSYILVSQPRLLIDPGIWDRNDPNGGPLSRARNQDVYSHAFRASYTTMFSPTVMNVVNASWGMYHNASIATSDDGDWLTKLGLGSGAGNFPQIDFGPAVNGVGTTGIGNATSYKTISNAYIITDNLSWIKGRHTFKFGFDGRLMQINSHNPGAPAQSYGFDHNQTGVPTAPWANQVGFGFASFLLGAVNTASAGVPFDLYGRRNYYALFAQDDFKVSPRLTLNLGLRWEATRPLTEKYGRWANFEYDLINTELDIPGALDFAKSGDDTFMRSNDWMQFGPRVGAAYRISNRLVARAAYGMMYLPLGLNFWSGVPYGFALGDQGVNRVNAKPDLSPAFFWDQGYAGTLVPGVRDPNLVQYPMVRIDPKALHAGRLQQWNAGVEFQIASNTVLGLNYVGNRGSRLPSDQFERNQPDAAAVTQLLKSGNEWEWVSDPASAAAAGVPYRYSGFSNYAWVALAPYPQIAELYAPLFVVGVPKGRSSFHAMEVTLSRRGVRGLGMELSYALSRARGNVDNAFEENHYNGNIQDVTRLDREANNIQAIDRTHIFKGFVTYELPFGKGRKFLSNRSPLVNALISGWNIAGIVRYQSGAPLRIQSNNFYQVWDGVIYPNVDPNGDFSRKFDGGAFNAANPADTGNRYFDGKPFTNPAYGEFGTGPLLQPNLRGFGFKSEDVSLMKNFFFGERVRLQFRAEFSNIFNRHYFNDPVLDISSELFGQVTSVTGVPRNGQLGIRVDW